MQTSYTSPNFDERANGVSPSMIILHYTGMETAKAALERLCDPAAKVSAHYVIDEDGTLYQLVDDAHRAWHAGVSYWAGQTDINSHSIGIELVNPGHEFGYRAFPAAQIETLTGLCSDLMSKYNIVPALVLGHSDVSPVRKQDPGELFPWPELAAQGVGLWPDPQEMDRQAAQESINDINVIDGLLGAYGYNVSESSGIVLEAFHRHFCPERCSDGACPAQADEHTIARLLSLLRQAHNA